MKRLYITLASFIAACSLAGCTAAGGTPLDFGAADAAPGIIIEESSSADAASGVPENDEKAVKFPLLSVKIMEWDEDKINELFIAPRNDIVDHQEHPYSETTDEQYHVFIGEEGDGKDGYMLSYHNGTLVSNTRRDFIKYGYDMIQAHWGQTSFGEYFNDGETALFPKEDAVNRTNALLDELGIKNYAAPEVYAITADKANALLENGEWWFNKSDGSPYRYEKWTADNEGYILAYPLEYDNVPLSMDSPKEIEGIYLGSHITAVVAKDGMISLEAHNVFSDEYEIGANVMVSITEEQAVEAAVKYFDGTYDAVRILDCRIVYMPIESREYQNIILVPMWKVSVSADNGQSVMRNYDTVFINVSTGAPLTNSVTIYGVSTTV